MREWLAGSGVIADLRIGVKKLDGQFEAHAWLEYEGIVLNDYNDEVEDYMTLQTDRGRLLSRLSNVDQGMIP